VPRYMIQVINFGTGDAAHWLALGGVVRQFFAISPVFPARAPLWLSGSRKARSILDPARLGNQFGGPVPRRVDERFADNDRMGTAAALGQPEPLRCQG